MTKRVVKKSFKRELESGEIQYWRILHVSGEQKIYVREWTSGSAPQDTVMQAFMFQRNADADEEIAARIKNKEARGFKLLFTGRSIRMKTRETRGRRINQALAAMPDEQGWFSS